MGKPTIQNWDRLKKPVRLSTRDLWCYRYAFPIFLAAFPTAFFAAGIIHREFLPFLLGMLFGGGIYFVMKRIWRLKDVYAYETFLEIRSFSRRVRIPYEKIAQVDESSWNAPSHATTIQFTELCEFGDVIRYQPYFRWSHGFPLSPWREPHPANLLIEHLRDTATENDRGPDARPEALLTSNSFESPHESEAEPTETMSGSWENPYEPIRLSARRTSLDWFLAPLIMLLAPFLLSWMTGDRFPIFIWAFLSFVWLYHLFTYIWKLKVVLAHSEYLEVCSLFHTIFVPYQDISYVKEYKGSPGPPTKIFLKEPCDFGDPICYRPYSLTSRSILWPLFRQSTEIHPANALIEHRRNAPA